MASEEKEKEEKKYNKDASTLFENLKKIQSESNARRAASAAERKLRTEARRKTMDKTSSSKGSSMQGLNTSLGGKIVTKK